VGVPARTPGAIHTSERADATARRLRRDLTFAERQLWMALRAAEGFHFRRQAPMGRYVVDFVCHRTRLIVEVDGGVHDIDAVAARDNERDAWLASRGYQVLRITNSEAIGATEASVAAILASAGAGTPTPDPSPQGGGERALRSRPT
jgi:very-short-patch-repair endonuclease